ncbi:MAG: replication protein [Desulfurispora sp.]|uniref:replication protein n=1 Tax=Desulfurispora sp. TaxID=3014275 RepID=UPI004049D7C8
MASVQDGCTQVPNMLLESLIRAGLNSTQLSICLFILRRTCGWGRENDSITLREFAAVCGSEETYVFKQLQELVRQRVITRSPGRPARYALQSDLEQWLCLPPAVASPQAKPAGAVRTGRSARQKKRTSSPAAGRMLRPLWPGASLQGQTAPPHITCPKRQVIMVRITCVKGQV